MILYCIRHGESTFNAEGRVQGQLDVPLSPLGVQQGQAVAAAFAKMSIDAIVSSPLARAKETAETIAASLDLPIRYEVRLKEIQLGVFQGQLWAEVPQIFPSEFERWRSRDPDYHVPGGESRRELGLRGQAALQAIRAGSEARVVVVAHGGVLTAAFKALLEIPPQRSPFLLYNGSISQVEWSDQPKLLTLNQVDHLQLAGCNLVSRSGEL